MFAHRRGALTELRSENDMSMVIRLCAVLIGLGISECLFAQATDGEAGAEAATPLNFDRDALWTTRATASLWAPSLNGNQSLRGSPEFDIDLIDQADVQAAPRLELTFRRDRWTVIASGFAFNIDQSATVDGGSFSSGGVTLSPGDRVRYDIDYWSADLLVGYRLPPVPISNGPELGVAADPFSVPSNGVGLFFDVLAGARVWHLDYQMDEIGGPELIDQKETWVDPVVGLRMLLDLPCRTGMELRSDVGGFGVGSEFSWNIEVAFRAQIAENIAGEIGFRHLQTDYEAGGGSDALDWDMALAGLYGSVVIRF